MSSVFLQTRVETVQYHSDTTAVFATLCQQKDHTLLLDSAEIQSKNSLKSLLIVNAAVKITCTDQTVTFTALTENGKSVLANLALLLTAKSQCIHYSQDNLVFQFTVFDSQLDEDTKLKALSVFDGLRSLLSLYQHSELALFLGGLFSYDLVMGFMDISQITLQPNTLDCPDYCFYLAEQLLVFDHQLQQATLQTYCFDPTQLTRLTNQAEVISAQLQNISEILPLITASTTVHTHLPDDDFKQLLSNLKYYLRQGDVFQIVPSRQFTIACPNQLAAYRQLKQNNPSPYMFFMQDSLFTLFGASPESALKFTPTQRQLEIYPIAGSRPRGFDHNGNIDLDLDSRLELELRLDEKELAEHLMLVDLARNDMARVCIAGSRQITALMQVDRYSHIMHLVSKIVGTLRPDLDALHAYQACMNMGTLTGAPKTRAMQLLYQFEQKKRHSYGGAVGYLLSDGTFDSCIVIRSAFVQNGIAYIQAGCGEVLDSDLQQEADETRHKANAVIQAIIEVNQCSDLQH